MIMYLDPGFGSIVIQMLIAAFAAGGTMFFLLRQKIAAFWTEKRRIRKEKEDAKHNE
jgi:uncharacterized protein (DUF2062 family)